MVPDNKYTGRFPFTLDLVKLDTIESNMHVDKNVKMK